MSDLQDIIAHNTHRAYEQGAIRERERILKLVKEQLDGVTSKTVGQVEGLHAVVSMLKEETE